MFRFLRLCFGTVARLFRSRYSLLLENLTLRQQLVVLKRRHPRPKLDLSDKLFWLVAGCTIAMIGLRDPISTLRRAKVGWIHCPYIYVSCRTRRSPHLPRGEFCWFNVRLVLNRGLLLFSFEHPQREASRNLALIIEAGDITSHFSMIQIYIKQACRVNFQGLYEFPDR